MAVDEAIDVSGRATIQALLLLSAQELAGAKHKGRKTDSPGFVPCPLDQWRDQKYLARRNTETAVRQAIAQNQKVYDGR